MNDRRRMKKLRRKRVESIGKQIEKHEEKIEKEKGRFDTTKDYWRKEIDEKFLKQIERTSLFIHLVDISPQTGRDPKKDFEIINRELKAWNPDMAKKTQVVALNKMDITEARERVPELLGFFKSKDIAVFLISAATGEGLDKLVRYVGSEVMRFKRKDVNKEANS